VLSIEPYPIIGGFPKDPPTEDNPKSPNSAQELCKRTFQGNSKIVPGYLKENIGEMTQSSAVVRSGLGRV
jgi:hypothetical protein